MGSNCSCFRTEYSQDDQMADTGSARAVLNQQLPSEAEEQTLGQLSLSKTGQVSLQCLAKGYMARSKIRTLSAFRKSGRSSTRYESVSKNLLKVFLRKKVDKVLGPLDLSKPLSDGKAVVEKNSLRLESGAIYQGEWDGDDIPHGRGVEERPDGTKLQGYFYNGLLQGIGRAILKDGSLFQGQFKNGRPSGEGTLVDTSNAKTHGVFERGNIIGIARKEFEDGSMYEGTFKELKMEGKGLFKWPNGDTYTGEFSDDLMNGRGKFVWADGKVYEGDFTNGDVSGRGNMTWSNGDVFDGEFKNGYSHGRGMLRKANGVVHKCCWDKGKEHGEGTISFKDEAGRSHLQRVVWDKGEIVESREDWKSK